MYNGLGVRKPWNVVVDLYYGCVLWLPKKKIKLWPLFLLVLRMGGFKKQNFVLDFCFCFYRNIWFLHFGFTSTNAWMSFSSTFHITQSPFFSKNENDTDKKKLKTTTPKNELGCFSGIYSFLFALFCAPTFLAFKRRTGLAEGALSKKNLLLFFFFFILDEPNTSPSVG